jgi:hypothetical protein
MPLTSPDADPAENREVEFVTFVLNDVRRTWEQLLSQAGTSYRHSKLVHRPQLLNSRCARLVGFLQPLERRIRVAQPGVDYGKIHRRDESLFGLAASSSKMPLVLALSQARP